MKKIGLILVVMLAFSTLAMAENTSVNVSVPGVEVKVNAPGVNVEVDTEKTAMGPLVNIDPANKIILVKDFNYETEEFSELAISIDEKTTLENFKSIDELKQDDELTVDYIVRADGKNIATQITLEETEVAQPSPGNAAIPAAE